MIETQELIFLPVGRDPTSWKNFSKFADAKRELT